LELRNLRDKSNLVFIAVILLEKVGFDFQYKRRVLHLPIQIKTDN